MAANVRSAKPADAEAILKIYAPHITDSAVSFETGVPTIHDMQERIKQTLEKFPWLVYVRDGVVVGYAYASPHRSRCAYEWSVESTVYIDSRFHGKGIGTELYRCLFELLKAQGVVNVFAGITGSNTASERIHKRFGFRPIGTFKNVGYKLDRWWDVDWWQLEIQSLEHPTALLPPSEYVFD